MVHHQLRSVPDRVKLRTRVAGVDVGSTGVHRHERRPRAAALHCFDGCRHEPLFRPTSIRFNTVATSVFRSAERSSSSAGFLSVNNKQDSPIGNRLELRRRRPASHQTERRRCSGAGAMARWGSFVGVSSLFRSCLRSRSPQGQWQTRTGDMNGDRHLDLVVGGGGAECLSRRWAWVTSATRR